MDYVGSERNDEQRQSNEPREEDEEQHAPYYRHDRKEGEVYSEADRIRECRVLDL